MMKTTIKSLFLLTCMTLSVHAFAQTTLNHCVIQEPLPTKHMTAAFFNVEHTGPDVAIERLEIPAISEHIELHRMKMNHHVMSMEKIDNPTLTQGITAFQKGGDHAMIMNIPDDRLPKAGEQFEMILLLKDGTQASCQAIVKNAKDLMNSTHPHH
ncbi:copper chaperone PCu(A)C [Basilea psittacipulmonis]|uniref:Copper-binding protein n=1 Tax=Basilea psittacipulmonis DSM 24701 TaxID=1072685 RepID=A0A077DI77_9BURK|nr:copper chaperone PCu(A)C [Basilea psittacipulmonis]AIL33212.1 hypothetical protein IX83_07810 [Basilea psittacipulmonis DSM 24701]